MRPSGFVCDHQKIRGVQEYRAAGAPDVLEVSGPLAERGGLMSPAVAQEKERWREEERKREREGERKREGPRKIKRKTREEREAAAFGSRSIITISARRAELD